MAFGRYWASPFFGLWRYYSTSDIYLSKVFSGVVIVFIVWMVNYFVIKSIAISVASQIKGSIARVTSTICVYDVFMIIR